MTAAPRRQSAPPPRARARGPVVWVFALAMGLLSVSLSAWLVGVLIGIGGCYTFWREGDSCERRAQALVLEDLGYIADAPRSLLVGDTVALSNRLVDAVRTPYEWLGLLRWYDRWHGGQPSEQGDQADPDALPAHDQGNALSRGMARGNRDMAATLSQWLLITMLVAQDVLLRLSVALYALPAFALACLLGVLDGMVRRDLRRWSGGRESSFVYHHAKHYTLWALSGGFGLYLSWPLGGFNPAWMVIVFTVLVAATLSTTVGAFKKYL